MKILKKKSSAEHCTRLPLPARHVRGHSWDQVLNVVLTFWPQRYCRKVCKVNFHIQTSIFERLMHFHDDHLPGLRLRAPFFTLWTCPGSSSRSFVSQSISCPGSSSGSLLPQSITCPGSSSSSPLSQSITCPGSSSSSLLSQSITCPGWPSSPPRTTSSSPPQNRLALDN